MSLDWEAAWHDAQEKLEEERAVRRQLAEALRHIHRTPSDVIFAALAASDALDEEKA